jgi:hypothetical protein
MDTTIERVSFEGQMVILTCSPEFWPLSPAPAVKPTVSNANHSGTLWKLCVLFVADFDCQMSNFEAKLTNFEFW